MTSFKISANACGTLRLIYEMLIQTRVQHPTSFLQRDFWDSIELFIDDTSPHGAVTDLEWFKDYADDLLEALDFFIENRNWFYDFKGIKFTKHITTRLRNSIISVQNYNENESGGFLTTDYDLYLEMVNAGAPEHHLTQFQFHNTSAPAEWF